MVANPCSVGRIMIEEAYNLEKGLDFIKDELLPELSLALLMFQKFESCLLLELEDIFGDDCLEIALLGFTWRLILPVAAREKSMAWEDAQLSPDKGLSFKMPIIVRELVKTCSKCGCWKPEQALSSASPLLPNNPIKMSELISRISQLAKDKAISANALKQAFSKAGIKCKIDTMIAHLKGAGVISPKLSSLQISLKCNSPLYEINPAVFILSF